MIYIGNTVVNTFYNNTYRPQIYIGNFQTWPVGATITVSPSSTAITSASNSVVFTVTSSESSWSVESNSAWATVTKNNNTRATATISENTAIASRSATISFKYNGSTYATASITQAAAAPYLNISPTSRSISEAAATGSVTVTTNIPTWDAYETPDYNWFSITKNGNTVTWSANANDGDNQRQAFITFSGNGISKQFTLTQDASYYFHPWTNSPMYISSGSNVNIDYAIESRKGNNPVDVSYSIGSNNIGLYYISSSVTSYYYVFTFGCRANTATTSASAVVTFTQNISYNQETLKVVQEGMHTISGLTYAATYNGWVLGTYVASYNGTTPMVAIVIVRQTPVNYQYTAHFNMYGGYGPAGSTPTFINVTTADTFTIYPNTTINIPSGDTCYGSIIYSPRPNQQIYYADTLTVV